MSEREYNISFESDLSEEDKQGLRVIIDNMIILLVNNFDKLDDDDYFTYDIGKCNNENVLFLKVVNDRENDIKIKLIKNINFFDINTDRKLMNKVIFNFYKDFMIL